MTPIKWNLADVWNEAAYKEFEQPKKRNYVYASEIGGPFYDRYLKMKGTEYTNPPNKRSLRKFLAGNIFEYMTKTVLIACGVFHREEVKIDQKPYTNCLDVHGRCDFIAGGKIDKEEALPRLLATGMPDELIKVGRRIIEKLHGQELERKIKELKSVSSFAMDRVEFAQCAIPNHSLQAFHYKKNSEYNAVVDYICKDDMRMGEFELDDEKTEELYRNDLLQMTAYYESGKKPPRDPLAKFDTMTGRFVKNFGVEYSMYLKHYGFDTPEDYRAAVGYVDRWNRALARFALVESGAKTPTGKLITLTPKNKEVKAEIIKAKYNFDECLRCKMELGVVAEEEEITE